MPYTGGAGPASVSPRLGASSASASGGRAPDPGDHALARMRRAWRRARGATRITVVLAACVLAAPMVARAQGSVDSDARGVLDAMSAYLGGLARFSVTYSAVDDIVTTEGQKVQFLHGGELLVQGPDRLRALRRGAAGAAEIILVGRDFILFGGEAKPSSGCRRPASPPPWRPCTGWASTPPGAICLRSDRSTARRRTSSAASMWG